MWHVNGNQTANLWLDLQPVRVLYEFDGPRIFTCKDGFGKLFLAYQCGESIDIMRFLIVPFSDDSERRLTEGELDLHDVLVRPNARIMDVDFDWTITQTWQVDVANLPADCIPRPGVMLWSHLQPRLASHASTNRVNCPFWTQGPETDFGLPAVQAGVD